MLNTLRYIKNVEPLVVKNYFCNTQHCHRFAVILPSPFERNFIAVLP